MNIQGVKKLVGLSSVLAVGSVFNMSTAAAADQCTYEVTKECPPFQRVYIGGQVGYSNTDVSAGDINNHLQDIGLAADDVSVDNDDMSYALFVGYRFNKHLAFEVGYLDLGERDVSFNGMTGTPDSDQAEHLYPNTGQGWDIAAVLSYPFAERWDVTGKIAVFNWDADYTITQDGQTVGNDSISGSDIRLGLGLGYHIRRDLQVYAEASTVELKQHRVNDIALGVRYFFDSVQPVATAAPVADPVVEDVIVEEVVVVAEPVAELSAEECEMFTGSIDGVQFENNSATLVVAAEQRLDLAVAALKQHESVNVAIRAYTDSRGSATYNQGLSERRADSVLSYLVGNGIDAERLSAEGLGEADPIADNETKVGRAANRRVEFTAVDTTSCN